MPRRNSPSSWPTLRLGIIFGFVVRGQIKNTRGAQKGAGLALAGIIVGFTVIALFLLAVVLVAILDSAIHRTSAPGH